MAVTIHRWAVAAIVACGLAVASAITVAPTAAAGSSVEDQGRQQILEATNDYRTRAGVPYLIGNAKIDAVAQAWAEKMKASRTLSHNPYYGSQMPQSGLSGYGENVAYSCGQPSVSAAVDSIMKAWKNSSGHYANMVRKSFTDIGIGFAYDSGSKCAFAVQDFGIYPRSLSTKFWDVPKTHQFYSEIDWLADSGVTTGYSDGSFRPDDTVSREAFAAFLYRLAGSPKVSLPSKSPFKDVSTKAPFYKEIVWMSKQGITTGWSDGTFRPKERISRDAMAAFLYRFYEEPSTKATSATKFRDIDGDSKFLREISWLSNAGISTGYSDGTFKPFAAVTREAMAAFLERAES